MSIIYEMSSHSQMVMNNNEILNELVKQRWKLAFKKEMGTRNFTIRVEIEHLPREQSGGMDPLYGLLDIVVKPTSNLQIYVDGDKTPVRLVNKDEILSKWKICKKEILDTYGSDENNLKMVENLEASFEDYILEVRTSTFYHILLSQWKTKKKWNFTTGSTTCTGDSVEIEFKRSEKTQNQEGQISWQLQGEGEAQHIAKFKKQYDQQLKQYALADFDYRYKIRTEYTEGKGLPGIDLFDTATTHIEEQNSSSYKFYNTIRFKRI